MFMGQTLDRQRVQSLVAAQQPGIIFSSDEETNTVISSNDSGDEVGENFGSANDTSSDKLLFTTTIRSGRVAGSWKNAFVY